jgi:hypothetical protein
MRKGARRFLLSSSNWNNSDKAGVGNRNANNVATNANTNISARLELIAIALSVALNSILTCTFIRRSNTQPIG